MRAEGGGETFDIMTLSEAWDKLSQLSSPIYPHSLQMTFDSYAVSLNLSF